MRFPKIEYLVRYGIVPTKRNGHTYDCGHPDCPVTQWVCKRCGQLFNDISVDMARLHDINKHKGEVVNGKRASTET